MTIVVIELYYFNRNSILVYIKFAYSNISSKFRLVIIKKLNSIYIKKREYISNTR